jgi:hypothetical protein
MELQRGITGFWHFKEPPLPACDMSVFRTHCCTAARSVGGRVVGSSCRPDVEVANFVMAVVDVSGIQVAVLMNRHFPIVGFAVLPGEGETGPLRFSDGDELAEALRASGWCSTSGTSRSAALKGLR